MNRRPVFLPRVLFFAGGLAVLWLTFANTRPPGFILGEGTDTDFSVERALADVTEISRYPRPMGSSEILRVRNYLIERLKGLNLAPELQEETVPDYFDVVPDSDRAARAVSTTSSTVLGTRLFQFPAMPVPQNLQLCSSPDSQNSHRSPTRIDRQVPFRAATADIGRPRDVLASYQAGRGASLAGYTQPCRLSQICSPSPALIRK